MATIQNENSIHNTFAQRKFLFGAIITLLVH